MPLAEIPAGLVLVVRAAVERDALHCVRGGPGPGFSVVELQELPATAAPASGGHVGAAAAISVRNGSADRGGDMS